MAIVASMAASIDWIRPAAVLTFCFERRPDEVRSARRPVRQLDPDVVVISAGEGTLTKRALAEATVGDLRIVK